MKTWVRKTLSVGVLAAGALLFAPGMAHADVSQNSNGNVGIANGTQVLTKVAVPLNVVGNSIGVAGESNAAGQGINWVESGKGGKYTQNSNGNVGILNGTQILVPVDVPVNVVGNAVSVLGVAHAAGSGVNKTESGKVTETTGGGKGIDQNSNGNVGVLNGTQVAAPINVPVNVCGNSLAILGLSNAQAACMNGGHSTEGGIWQGSNGNVGIGNGTQVALPVYAPINVTGNAASVAGVANAAGASQNESGHKGGGIKQDSNGNVGVLNGTQVAAPITIPVNVCGNAIAVLGVADAAAACSNDTKGNGGHQGGDDNDGDHGGYPGDDSDDVDGDGGATGHDDTYGEAPRKAHKAHQASSTEGTAVDGLTQNLSNAGGVNLGGLDVQKLLK